PLVASVRWKRPCRTRQAVAKRPEARRTRRGYPIRRRLFTWALLLRDAFLPGKSFLAVRAAPDGAVGRPRAEARVFFAFGADPPAPSDQARDLRNESAHGADCG